MTKIYGRFLLNVIYLAGDTHRAPKPTKRVNVKVIPSTRVAWLYSLAVNNFLGKVILNVLSDFTELTKQTNKMSLLLVYTTVLTFLVCVGGSVCEVWFKHDVLYMCQI